jgi:Ulp1 family protease
MFTLAVTEKHNKVEKLTSHKIIHIESTDLSCLQEGEWLTDAVINNFQKLLQHQFPMYDGFLNTINVAAKQAIIIRKEAIQIIHINSNHWVCITVYNNKDIIDIYDSLYSTITWQCL